MKLIVRMGRRRRECPVAKGRTFVVMQKLFREHRNVSTRNEDGWEAGP